MISIAEPQRQSLRHQWSVFWRLPWKSFVIGYLAYILAARIGLSLAIPDGASPVWPASGVALALLLRVDRRMAIAIFAANLSVQFFWAPAALPLWGALLMAAGAAIEPLVSVMILQRWCNFDKQLMRLRDIALLALVGAPIGALLNSILATLTLCGSGAVDWHFFSACLETFWFGNVGGIIMLTAPLLAWTAPQMTRGAARPWRPARLSEAVAILMLLSLLPLGLPVSNLHSLKADPDAIAFLCFPLIAWASIRLDFKLSTAITFLVSVESIATARWSVGLFRHADPDEILIIIQLFVLSLSATNQLLSGLARQEKTAASALREREEFLSLAVRGSNDGLFDFDRASRGLWLSPRWREQLGYGAEDLSNALASWRRLLLREDRGKAIATFRALDRGTAVQGECILRFRHRSGRIIHILLRAAVHRRPDGRITRVVGTHTDITDLVTARQELDR
jgi:PAS domain S-box-containing protein